MMVSVPVARIRRMVRRPGSSAVAAYTGRRRAAPVIIAVDAQRDGHREPTGVGSTARMDSTAGKVGKVSRVASALPHSEGAAYKRGP